MYKFKVGDIVRSKSVSDTMDTSIVSNVLPEGWVQVTPLIMHETWTTSAILGYFLYRYNNLYRVEVDTYPEIIIYNIVVNNNQYTIAIDTKTGEKGVAKFHLDASDVTVRSEIALAKLYDGLATQVNPSFVPHLSSIKFATSDRPEKNILGTPTNFIDIAGNRLRIGDTVSLYSPDMKYVGEHVIRWSGLVKHPIVQGIAALCKSNGNIEHGWTIALNRKYEEIPNGTVINDYIKYIKEDKQCEK